jgi:NAD(P)-dependent dehydrogenase (short-subunit alcohol dehydrogenase family)
MLPPRTFEDTVVVITGGGTGIGRAIAAEFGRLGATVAVTSRKPEHRDEGIVAVNEAGGRGIGIECDVRDPAAVAQAFDGVEQAAGAIGVLVNNAAGNFPVLAEEMSPNAWRAVTTTVLDGTFFCSTEFARRSIAAEQPGAILNIGATYSWTGGPGTSHSAAAKAAVWNLTMSLAVEWAPYGIRVNGLAPGRFPHQDLPSALIGDGSTLYRADNIPAGRVGELHELGWAATYLCSPYAAYLTGHTMVLDGANWLRRGLGMPEFVPVAQQLGR